MEKYLFYDENNTPIEFIIEAKFQIDNTSYVAVYPSDDNSGDLYILKISKDENGNEILVGIDDEELEEAIEAYEELIEDKE